MYKSFNQGHLGIQTAGFEETLSLAKRHGFNAVNYCPYQLEKEGLDVFAAQDLMGQYGVIISDFPLPVNISNKESFADTFPKLEKAARMASQLGAYRTIIWVMSSSKDYDFAENFRFHTNMFRQIATVLGEYGIRFGLEFLGPHAIRKLFTHPFIHSIDKMLELCDAVGTGNIGLLVDAHHAYCDGLKGGDFAKYIRNEKDIVLVHINDTDPALPLDQVPDSPRFYPGEPGSGANDLAGFMKALKDLNYTGPVQIEPFSNALKGLDNETIAKTIAQSMESVWPK